MKSNLTIQEIVCATCVSPIEDTVTKLDGVDSVDVNFATDEATLEPLRDWDQSRLQWIRPPRAYAYLPLRPFGVAYRRFAG